MAYFGTLAAHNTLVHGRERQTVADAGVLIAGHSGVNLCLGEAVPSKLEV